MNDEATGYSVATDVNGRAALPSESSVWSNLAVDHTERRITAPDGTALHVERWSPTGAVKFVVVIVHGGGEHVGRYARLAERWARNGGMAFGPDHRGQGKSGGVRGHVGDFGQYADDLRAVVDATIEDLPAAHEPSVIPFFLFGHSMGGLIALTALLDGKAALPLRGAIISSPLLGLAMKVSPVKVAVGKLAGFLAPRLAMPSGVPPEVISRDPDEVARYAKDPRRTEVVTAGWFSAMNRAIASVESQIMSLEVPLLWYRGTGDRLCDADAMARVFHQLPDPEGHDQTLRSFEGYYHELHNEPAALREPVLEMIDAWIDERL